MVLGSKDLFSELSVVCVVFVIGAILTQPITAFVELDAQQNRIKWVEFKVYLISARKKR